jgi:uncharacterized delta-60 repeat protein
MGTHAGIERLESRYFLSAGRLDDSFGTHGIIDHGTTNGLLERLIDIAPMPDGRFMTLNVNDDFTGFQLARFNHNGTIDSTFAENGLLTRTDVNATAMAITPDGLINVVFRTDDSCVAYRYKPDGTRDRSWSRDAIALHAVAIAIDSQGRLLVTGSGGQHDDLAVARFTNRGTRDLTFGDAGQTVIDLNHDIRADGFLTSGKGEAVAAAVDGTVYVGGTLHTDDGKSVQDQGFITRFDANGSYRKTVRTSYSDVDALAVQSDGKVVVGLNDVEVARFTRTLSLDSTFSSNGIATILHEKGVSVRSMNSIIVQSDGAIDVAGVQDDQSLSPLITRFRTDGTIDRSFTRADGLSYAPAGDVAAIAEAADGSILFASQAFGISKLWRDDAPAAQLLSATQRKAGANPLLFQVEYHDAAAMDVESLDSSDLQIVNRRGETFKAYFVAEAPAPGFATRATYKFSPIDRKWDITDNGTYTVLLKARQVSDAAGHFAASRVLGTIRVAIPISGASVGVTTRP